jgi:hypothetical protein
MTKEELQAFIISDTTEFWVNSVNPVNSDSLFIVSGITDLKEAVAFPNTANGNIVKALFQSTYLVKGEYIVTYMNAMLLTNRRLFTFYTSETRSIALKNLIKYERQPDCLFVEYLENGIIQTFRIKSTFLNTDAVNNAMARHQNDIVSEQELELLSATKIVLDGRYGFTNMVSTQSVSNQSLEDNKEYQRKGNRNGLILFLIIISLVGGCGYFLSNWSKSYEANGNAGTAIKNDTHSNSISGKKQKKCPWCGGIGKVGYAGKSEAQVKRTGMGLGNYCTVCTGTGYVDDDE